MAEVKQQVKRTDRASLQTF